MRDTILRVAAESGEDVPRTTATALPLKILTHLIAAAIELCWKWAAIDSSHAEVVRIAPMPEAGISSSSSLGAPT